MKKTNPVKEELKNLASQIKQSKLDLKQKQRTHSTTWKDHYNVNSASSEFRHKHIAYCLLKGRTYEQIEQPKEGNEPNFDLIKKYKEEMTKILEEYYHAKENVCDSSTGS